MVLEALSKMARHIVYGGGEKPLAKVLPETVREQLMSGKQNAQGETVVVLNKTGIESLINNGFWREAIYMLTKAFDGDPESLRYFLSDLTKILIEENPVELKTYLKQILDQLPDDTEVMAAKLASISRMGFEPWYEGFRNIAEEGVRVAYILHSR